MILSSALMRQECLMPAPDGCAKDCSYCEQELAKELFDPDKFSGVFTSGGSGPPRWLDGPSGLTADR